MKEMVNGILMKIEINMIAKGEDGLHDRGLEECG